MPLIRIEKLTDKCSWGLWEIKENLEDLELELTWEKAILPVEVIRLDDKKKEKLASRILLKKLLETWNETYFGTSSHITRKPYLLSSSYPISVTHSHGKAAAIIHHHKEVGIDIELINPKIATIAPRVLRPEELEFAKNDPATLTTLWSMKETLYKINGERGIDFREQLFISPFDINCTNGMTIGIIKTRGGESTYNLKYERHENHVIAFNI